MVTVEQHKEIEFTGDRETWHTGPAQPWDLFYRTRTVIDGQPTEWKVFVMPSVFVKKPLWIVWNLMKEIEPYPVEAYDAFEADLKKLKDKIHVGQIQDRIERRGIHYSDQ